MPKAKRKSFKGNQTREQTTNGVKENEMESESEQWSINTKDAMLAEMKLNETSWVDCKQGANAVSSVPQFSFIYMFILALVPTSIQLNP